MASSEDRWKDMDITKDEVDRIGKALKDETFRKMFVEYAEELADPKNRELYEQEIAQMEADRGMDVQFIHPKPGHVLKVMAKSKGTSESTKVFVNVCQNEFIATPSHEKKKKPDGSMGLQWSIPHSFSPAREDLDKKRGKCSVYDVVFHPDTYKMSSNPGFLKMLHDTALEGLERQFGIQIDRQTMVRLKHMTFKGRVEPTIMRKKKEGTTNDQSTNDGANKENDPLSSFPYPYEEGVTSEDLAKKKAKQVEEDKKRKQAREQAKQQPKGETQKDGVIVPQYTMTNRYGVDMSDYSQSLSGTPMPLNHLPSELVVSIHLPKLSSAAPCSLDVTERNLSLESTKPVSYSLSLKLPYPVDDENGTAKFDKTKKRLVVTLPVRKDKVNRGQEEATHNLVDDNSNGGVMLEKRDDNSNVVTPLIEELPAKQIQSAQVAEESSKLKDFTPNQESSNQLIPADTKNSGVCGELSLDTKISYKLPKFSYDQDEDTVSLVLEVARVNPQTYKYAYHEATVEIMFATHSPSGFPTYYYIKCIFPHLVTAVTKDMGETNLVLTIEKEASALWDNFLSGGTDSGDLQKNQFLTKADILNDLEELKGQKPELGNDACDAEVGDGQYSPVVKVEPLDLTSDSQVQDEDREGENLASPPVVVHKYSPPNIAGILKRTTSESSADDQLHHIADVGAGDSCLKIACDPDKSSDSSNGSSPIDLPSPRERKKSVSFSDKVEETMFKSKDSVCHMHKTLLNRRKKQRQRENRKENQDRIRRNSSTDHSSGDEQHSKRRGGRRRRHSSSTSEDSALSPRSPTTDPMTSSTELANDQARSCEEKSSSNPPVQAKEANNQQSDMVLNSDDDEDGAEEGYHETNGSSTKGGSHSVTNWSDSSQFVDKTKCAFDFNNSVIFDLD